MWMPSTWPGRLVGDDLHEAFGVADGDGLAERGEREAAGLHGEAGVLRLLLGVADGADCGWQKVARGIWM